jgi:hypothetical protein
LTEAKPNPDSTAASPRRSKRLFVYWGIALTLLITGGLFCWLVVVPFLQIRGVLKGYSVSTWSDNPPAPAEIQSLGGREAARKKLVWYLSLPRSITVEHKKAVALLGACGEDAVADLERLLVDEDIAVRRGSLYAMAGIGGQQAIDGLIGAACGSGQTEELRTEAQTLLAMLSYADRKLRSNIVAELIRRSPDTTLGRRTVLGKRDSTEKLPGDDQLIDLYRRFLQVCSKSDFEALRATTVFESPEAEVHTKLHLLAMAKIAPVDSRPVDIHIAVKRYASKNGWIKVVYITTRGRESYIPRPVEIAPVGGEMKIRFVPNYLGGASPGGSQVLQSTAARWHKLNGAELKKAAKHKIQELKDSLAVVKYAQREGLQLHSGYGSSSKWTKLVKEYEQLTPEQVKQMILKSIQRGP